MQTEKEKIEVYILARGSEAQYDPNAHQRFESELTPAN
jgi:hypothetical protein